MRAVLNAIFYLNRSGCQWDMLPHDLPAKSTVYNHFSRWRDDGTWHRIMDALRQEVRVAAGKDLNPSAGSIDSQTVKGSEVGGVRGYDGGKKLRGIKRHIIVDTLGLLLVVVVSAASADDGTCAPEVLRHLSPEHRTRLELIWADGKYNTRSLDRWMAKAQVGYRVEVISRPADAKGFVKLPRRWAVKRTFAWIGRYRRDSRDYEGFTETSESMIRISSIHRRLRKLSPDTSKKANPFKYREIKAKVTGAAYETFQKDDRFAMVGLSLDQEEKAPREYVEKNSLGWHQAFLGDFSEAKLPAEYGVRGIPSIWLIGPDGKVVAKDLRGDAIKDAIAKALGEAK